MRTAHCLIVLRYYRPAMRCVTGSRGSGSGVLSAAGALMVVHRDDGNGVGPRPGVPLAADLGAAGGAAVAIGLGGTFPLPVLGLSTLAEIFIA